MLQNTTYLRSPDGDNVDHVGFETTLQSESAIGIAYFFEIPDEIDDYEWVYKTPAAIVRRPIEYEIADIALP